MKKLLSIILLCLFLCLQMACQYSHRYMVVNATDSPITVKYYFKGIPDQQHPNKRGIPVPTFYYVEPKIKWANDVNKEPADWQKLPGAIRDEEAGALTVSLQPGEALQVFEDSGLAEYEYERPVEERSKYSNFPIAGLSISGSKGEITFSGDCLFKQFIKYEGFIYQIRYE